MSYRSRPIWAAIIGAAACFGTITAAIAQARVRYDLPEQTLEESLRAIGKSGDINILIDRSLVSGLRAAALKAELRIDEALALLLEGTGLTYEFVNENTVVLAPRKPEGTAKEALPQGITELEEVVVTGSHIRGTVAAGSKLIVIDRPAIEAGGYSRLQDIVRDLPQNFSNVGEANGADVRNGNRGAEIQLRGLGSGTTLTLVNGQRQAAGGEAGDFVDISTIAASAIERIEILSEGASALYGSDAIGGVVNIILRKDFEGFETSVRGGTADGGAEEFLASQLWGKAWSQGRVLIGYQYDERDPLPASARAYAASNGDFRRFGGTDQRSVGGNPGTIVNASGRAIAAIPGGQDGRALTPEQLIPGQSNYFDNVTYSSLLPAEKMHSAFISSSYDITDGWAVSLDGRYSTRDVDFLLPQSPRSVSVPAVNAFSPFNGSTQVAYDFTQDVGPIEYAATTDAFSASMGVTGSLPGLWQIKFSAGYAEEMNVYRTRNTLHLPTLQTFLNSADPSVAFNVFGDGANTAPATIAALRNAAVLSGRRSTYDVSSAELIANGPVLDLPAGAVKLALGGSYREEELDNLSFQTLRPRGNDRGVSAVFAELAVPVWQGSTRPDTPSSRVELSLAARYEDYNDFGHTLDPKVGLSWQPWSSLKLRGTWGTSFRAPPLNVMEGYFQGTAAVVTVPDRPPASSSLVLGVIRPDAVLTEETAEVWTAGVDFAPSFAAGLSLSFTFFDVAYQDKIANPNRNEMLVNEAQYARYIVRNPTRAQLDAYCVDGRAAGYTVSGNCNQPLAAILDISATNLSLVETRGVDADLRYDIDSSFGQWYFGLRGTYVLDYETAVVEGLPAIDPLDTYRNPLSLRMSGAVGWHHGGWNVQASVKYTGGYDESTLANAREIEDWTTVDLTVGYQLRRPEGWLDRAKLSVSVINLFDEDPPFVNFLTGNNANGVGGYDTANANILGRQIGVQLVKPW